MEKILKQSHIWKCKKTKTNKKNLFQHGTVFMKHRNTFLVRGIYLLLWVDIRSVNGKVWFPCIVWGSVCLDRFKTVIQKFDSSSMKTCFSKMIGMFLLFWYIPCFWFKGIQTNKPSLSYYIPRQGKMLSKLLVC